MSISEYQNAGGKDNTENEHNGKSGLAGLFDLYGCNEKRTVNKEQERVCKCKVTAQKSAEAEQQWHCQSRGRNGNAEIMLALFGRLLLAGFLGDIVISKSYKARKGKQSHYRYLPPCIRTDVIADGNGQHAEANYIAERIELDTVAAFLIGAILFAASNNAVKHIAETGKHQAYDRCGDFAAAGKADAHHRRKHADISQPDGVVIETYHRLTSPISFFVGCIDYNTVLTHITSYFDALLSIRRTMQIEKRVIYFCTEKFVSKEILEMVKTDVKYLQYLQILKEELIPAMGCTEPIAMAYAAAKARAVLDAIPEKIDIVISGNIIKNVKSVIVPNTGGMKGITAAIAAGIAVGDADRQLEVLADVRESDIHKIAELMESCAMTVMKSSSDKLLDIDLHLYKGSDSVRLRICDFHTNIVLIEKNGETLLKKDDAVSDGGETDRSVLNVHDIVDFAESVDIDDVRELLEKQIEYNLAISEEGLHGSYGASIGKTLIETRGGDVRVRARAQAAAGSDARMSGCEMPVVIVSGSGNQGMTASLPVIVYANDMGASHEKLLRALIVSNLITIHQKTPIGRLSAFCGAVSAGCGAAAGVAWLIDGTTEAVSATITNTLGMISGTVCDGAKPSCAAKIASAVEAGLLGFDLYESGKGLHGGDGILKDDVEKTIESVGQLAREGMRETDAEILDIMLED